MNSKKLSKRLKAVADYVPKHSYVADIGSDHAYLPVYLVETGIIDQGIVSEVSKGPFNNLKTEIEKEDVGDALEPRLANGLDAIGNDNVDVVSIAGMGGNLITEILKNGQGHLNDDCRLILQPNVGEMKVRKYLMDHHYRIIAENIVDEDDHIYEIIVAEKSSQKIYYSDDELYFGPQLLKTRGPEFNTKWTHRIEWIKRVIDQMNQAKTNKPIDRINDLKQEIKRIERIL